MTDSNKKEEFSWEEGSALNEGNSSALGDIRAHGLPKINKALAKDPVLRKKERERYLAEKQSQPYQFESYQHISPRKDVIVEESDEARDLSGKFDDSEVKRLTDRGNRFRGLGIFGKKK